MLRSFRSLQTKLVLLFGLVLLIPTAIIGIYTINSQTESTISRARVTAYNAAQLVAGQIEDRFMRVVPDLKLLTTLAAVQAYLQNGVNGNFVGQNLAIADINRAFLAFIRTIPDYDKIQLLNAKGIEIARVNRTRPNDPTIQPYIALQAELQDRSNQDYFQEARKLKPGQMYVSNYSLNQEFGKFEEPYKPVLRISTPLYDSTGNLGGIVVLSMLGSYITHPLIHAPTSAEHYLVDQKGTYLWSPDPNDLYSPDLRKGISFLIDRPKAVRALWNQLPPEAILQDDFIESYISIQPPSLPSLRWLLFQRTSTEVALAELNNLRLVTLALAGLALLGAVLVALFVTRSIVSPVRKLAAATNEVAAGNLRVTVPEPRTKDEIGELTRSFAQMTARLNENVTALQIRAKELETANALAREASRVKSEFLATMSHELRTPLNAMIGFTELLMSGVSGPLTDKQNHQLKRIHGNSLRLLSLIDDVLDLSRIEAGRVEIVNKPVHIREFAENVTAQTASLVLNKPFTFSVQVEDNLPEVLMGDRDRLEEVVLNLLSNAFKFTHKGEVALRFYKADDKHWAFSVRDTGIGIPAHAQEYIFEEFRQVDGTSRRAYGGSGLGLAICRNLCRLMGGEIGVKSTLGEGSTFTVRLPLVTAEEATAPALPEPAHA